MKSNTTQNETKTLSIFKQDPIYWHSLGFWNFYFLAKFGLLFYGYLKFNAFYNAAFLAFLLFPLRYQILHQIRKIAAIPIGFGLLYHDTWLPSIKTIIYNSHNVTTFKTAYIIELLNRFINWPLIGMIFIALTIYIYCEQWIRMTTITILSIFWLNIQPIILPSFNAAQFLSSLTTNVLPNSENLLNTQPMPINASDASQMQNQAVNTSKLPTNNVVPQQTTGAINTSAPATTENLNVYLDQFYAQEKTKRTQFPAQLPADATPFDVLILNICSLSISDLQASNLLDHPLWKHLDVSFTKFNSATSYSGPAAIRLLRSSCGQPPHSELYKEVDKQCHLFENLASLGFKENLVLDHDGSFDDYLKHLREYGGISVPLMPQDGLKSVLTAFNNAVIHNDDLILERWLETRKKETDIPRSASFANLIPLHDGNHYAEGTPSDYKIRAKKLFDNLDKFLTELETSGRKVLVIIVPEHGAALVGDKMQISGLRDIPSYNITHVPAGLKLIGAKAPHSGTPLQIDSQLSYFAISELISRMVDGKVFTSDTLDWQALMQNLPVTPIVSENENAIIMYYQDKPYIRMDGGDWIPYPL